ncbi:MAG: HAD family phosphatase [Candidatus Liptonbacteria bacterium]
MAKKQKLYIFDLDGTLIDDMPFYKKIYSENLEQLVGERYGVEGLRLVNMMRRANGGKGEFALLALGISYDEWLDRISEEQIAELKPRPGLVKAVRSLDGIKVIFTGTSKRITSRILARAGFKEQDFEEIVAMEKPAVVPIKLTADPLVFEYLLNRYSIKPGDAYTIGDEYRFDVLPAKSIGMHTIEVRHNSGSAEYFALTILDAIEYLKSLQSV